MLTTRHCEHIKANGHFCGSPAMRGRNYCHFHLAHIGRQLRKQRYGAYGLGHPPLELPLLEDAASIQLALMQVTEALLHGSLDHRTAGLVLYSLQTASSNLRTMQKDAEADAEAGNAICNRYDSFEQDYELGDSCADLRVQDAEEEEELAASGVEHSPEDEATTTPASSEDETTTTAPAPGDGSDPSESPRPRRILKLRDENLEIPRMLTEEQYLQAKVAMFQYRMDHNLDARDVAKQVIPQRAAISQKIILRERKPVSSIRVEQQPQQLEVGHEV